MLFIITLFIFEVIKKVIMMNTNLSLEVATPDFNNAQITWDIPAIEGFKKQEITRIRRMVMILSHSITKNNKEVTQSQALKAAWKMARKYESSAWILLATKKDGTKMKRVVLENWHLYNTVKGTGRPLKEGLKLFVDVAKKEMGLNSTITATKGLYNLI